MQMKWSGFGLGMLHRLKGDSLIRDVRDSHESITTKTSTPIATRSGLVRTGNSPGVSERLAARFAITDNLNDSANPVTPCNTLRPHFRPFWRILVHFRVH